jgi:hypothetical protein
MSNNLVPSIETLPVELFHRIFDNLDAETILFSIRPVCRLFRSVVNTYNRYVLDLKSISRSNFHIFCRLIDPGDVISLTLSNDEPISDQVSLFLSLFRPQEFTRLRSLTLLHIDEVQLNFMLQRINLNFLISFSFNIRKYDYRRRETTINLLSSIAAQSTFRKLEFDMKSYRMSKISWPINSPIQCLTINNNINIDKLCTILQGSPHLHTLIMSEISERVINHLTSICFRQLTSLTIKMVFISIDELEPFLLMTPSLVYLKLIDGKKMMDGKRWEQFIQINLPRLDKFEFAFSERRLTKQTPADLELIIASFRTPFWIEDKKWFVICEYTMPRSHNVYLYSIPICKSHIIYVSESKKTSLSTYPMMMNKDSTIMDNINSFRLTLNKSLVNDIQEKVCY